MIFRWIDHIFGSRRPIVPVSSNVGVSAGKDIRDNLITIVHQSNIETKLSALSNAQLRERASRFTAQLREFEAEHKLEERRISHQEIQTRHRQLPIRNAEDSERAYKISQEHLSAMVERGAQYQAAFNTRFRSRALEFREELCRREGIYSPYKVDMRSTDALDAGILAGINPVSQVGDYLDELIRKLPESG